MESTTGYTFTGDIGAATVDGKDIEVVTKFVFLGALITPIPRTDYARRKCEEE